MDDKKFAKAIVRGIIEQLVKSQIVDADEVCILDNSVEAVGWSALHIYTELDRTYRLFIQREDNEEFNFTVERIMCGQLVCVGDVNDTGKIVASDYYFGKKEQIFSGADKEVAYRILYFDDKIRWEI